MYEANRWHKLEHNVAVPSSSCLKVHSRSCAKRVKPKHRIVVTVAFYSTCFKQILLESNVKFYERAPIVCNNCALRHSIYALRTKQARREAAIVEQTLTKFLPAWTETRASISGHFFFFRFRILGVYAGPRVQVLPYYRDGHANGSASGDTSWGAAFKKSLLKRSLVAR